MDDLSMWLIDKDAEGLIKPPPGVVYDRPGYGIAFMDDRGRDFTLADIGGRLDAWCGQGVRLTPATARDLAAALIRFAQHAEQAARSPAHGPG